MLKTPISVHHAGLPTADVDVSNLILGDFIVSWRLLGPKVITEAMVDAINHLASVFRAVFVCHVTFTSFLVEGPVSSVTAGIVCIYLNTEAMAHFGDVSMELFRNQRYVFNNQG